MKDIRLDFRGKREVLGLITLGLVCLLIFGMSTPGGLGVKQASKAVLFVPYWVTVLFLMLLSTLWIFEREKQNGTLQALVLACRESSSIFIGKFLAYLVRHLTIQIALMLVFLTFHNLLTLETLGWFALINLLVCLGFTSVGILTAALLSGSGVTGSLGGVLLFPLLIPMVLAAVGALEAGTGLDGAESRNWVELLAAGVVLLIAFPVAVFDKIIED